MTRYHRTLAGLFATAAIAAIAFSAAAQTPPPAPGDQREARMQHREEIRARALHDALNLRPDQDAAFQAFEAAVAPPQPGERPDRAGRPDGDADDEAGGALTTPERLDRMAARLAERQAEFQRRADATRQFYAVLSPEQKRAFDAMLTLRASDRAMFHPPFDGPGHPG